MYGRVTFCAAQARMRECALPFICASDLLPRGAQPRCTWANDSEPHTHSRRPNTHFSFLFAAESRRELKCARREEKSSPLLNALGPQRVAHPHGKFFLLWCCAFGSILCNVFRNSHFAMVTPINISAKWADADLWSDERGFIMFHSAVLDWECNKQHRVYSNHFKSVWMSKAYFFKRARGPWEPRIISHWASI